MPKKKTKYKITSKLIKKKLPFAEVFITSRTAPVNNDDYSSVVSLLNSGANPDGDISNRQNAMCSCVPPKSYYFYRQSPDTCRGRLSDYRNSTH